MNKFVLLFGLLIIFGSAVQGQSTSEDEWYGFDYNEAGISASEFDMVKAHQMPRKELEELLEIGIMPEAYFSEPWKKLGISKSEWLSSKKEGMSDDDLDTRVYTQQRFNYEPIVTFFLPGYYQYQKDKMIFGAGLTTVAVSGIALTLFVQEETNSGSISKTKKRMRPEFLLLTFLSMAVSASDAYIGTRYNNNKGAARFSFNLLPTSEPKASFSLNF